MIQTSYATLDKPYHIIEYNGELGIQIGTLIVTKEKKQKGNDGYAIETHSHPVVSYVNKKMPLDFKNHKSLSMPRPFEGVVWDKVELYELNVITREDEGLTWEDFMQLCKKLRLRELENRNFDAEIQTSVMEQVCTTTVESVFIGRVQFLSPNILHIVCVSIVPKRA